ncbi:unnamed protein product [Cochlearia groenlandica]
MSPMLSVDFQNSLILILLSILSLLYYALFFKKQKHDLPPSPPSLPIIGHLHLLVSSLTHKSLQKLSHKYGPLLHLRAFNVPIVLVSSPSMANEIFKTHDVNVSFRGEAAYDESLFLGSSALLTAPYGYYFKFVKKLLHAKFFKPRAMEKTRGERTEELVWFYANLLCKANKKESLEINVETMKLTSNSICRMSIGRLCDEENGEANRFDDMVTKWFSLTKKIFVASVFRKPLEMLGISLFKKEIMRGSRETDEMLEKILVEHEKKLDEDKEKDMMDLLLEAYRDENAEYKITRKQIKSLILETFIGGTDTSVHAIEWTMSEIINNPNVLESWRKEIDSVVGKTRMIQESDLPNLPYLQAVVKEGLRMYPPAPLLVRMFQENCELKGFHVPKETLLIVNLYALMRDPDSWEDPNEFKPERFLTCSKSGQEGEVREQAMKYIPFGFGRRGCPGLNLAYIFVGTAVGVMVQCFDWRIEGDRVRTVGTQFLQMGKLNICE